MKTRIETHIRTKLQSFATGTLGAGNLVDTETTTKYGLVIQKRYGCHFLCNVRPRLLPSALRDKHFNNILTEEESKTIQAYTDTDSVKIYAFLHTLLTRPLSDFSYPKSDDSTKLWVTSDINIDAHGQLCISYDYGTDHELVADALSAAPSR